MNRKVLFTASTYSHIHNFHLPYLKYFADNGWTVHLACADAQCEASFVHRAIDLPFEKKMHSAQNIKATRKLRRLIFDENYDLVITHTSLAAFFTRLAVKGMRSRPWVINVAHGYLFGEAGVSKLKNKILVAAEKIVAGQTDLVLTMNEWDYNEAKRLKLAERIEAIPGIGVDFAARCGDFDKSDSGELREKYSISQDAFVLFYAAEFSARKSQDVLIRAMTMLDENIILVLAGTGDTLSECESLAKELGVENRVIFPGYVEGVAQWYRAADAAVTASRSEGLPFNVMEAMYCALPVVASAVKGHTDLITDGENGFLYPYGDWRACAEIITKLSKMGAQAQKTGEQARQSAQRYSLENILPVVIEKYLSLIK